MFFVFGLDILSFPEERMTYIPLNLLSKGLTHLVSSLEPRTISYISSLDLKGKDLLFFHFPHEARIHFSRFLPIEERSSQLSLLHLEESISQPNFLPLDGKISSYCLLPLEARINSYLVSSPSIHDTVLTGRPADYFLVFNLQIPVEIRIVRLKFLT
jgi:hypothetical protein